MKGSSILTAAAAAVVCVAGSAGAAALETSAESAAQVQAQAQATKVATKSGGGLRRGKENAAAREKAGTGAGTPDDHKTKKNRYLKKNKNDNRVYGSFGQGASQGQTKYPDAVWNKNLPPGLPESQVQAWLASNSANPPPPQAAAYTEAAETAYTAPEVVSTPPAVVATPPAAVATTPAVLPLPETTTENPPPPPVTTNTNTQLDLNRVHGIGYIEDKEWVPMNPALGNWYHDEIPGANNGPAVPTTPGAQGGGAINRVDPNLATCQGTNFAAGTPMYGIQQAYDLWASGSSVWGTCALTTSCPPGSCCLLHPVWGGACIDLWDVCDASDASDTDCPYPQGIRDNYCECVSVNGVPNDDDYVVPSF